MKAAQWRSVVERGKPSRFITLTCDPSAFETPFHAIDHLTKMLPRLLRDIRREYGYFEYVKVWELHKSGWPHIHIAARCNFIPQKWLSQRWEALGCGKIVDIRKVTKGKLAARYVAKYLGKACGDMARMLRKTRIITKSRGYVLPDPKDSEPAELKDFKWRASKGDYWKIVSDLASCGATVLSKSTYTLRTVFDVRNADLDPYWTALDVIPWCVFADDGADPPT